MLKAEIAGEEVLSNKEITISQEMLKTSSTILNNCYPKSWETAHDYISNFYFPKDYSKCKIYDVENITPIVGTRVSGNNFSINYDSSLSWDFEQLKGNTTQDSYSGVNLYNYRDTTTISSGVTADSNGWITITANNSSGSSIMWKNYYTNNLNLQTSTQYAIFLEVKSVSGNGLLEVTSANATSQFSIVNEVNFSSLQANKVYKYLSTTKSSFDGTSNGLRNYTATQAGQSGSITFRLSVLADKTVTPDNFVYQPYVGGTPSPNPDYPQAINNVTGEQVVEIAGKNLYNPSYRRQNGTLFVNNCTGTEENGTFTLTATGSDMFMWNVTNAGSRYDESRGQLYEFKEDSYTVSTSNSDIKKNYVTYYDKNGVSLGYTQKASTTFTINKSDKAGAKYFTLRFGYGQSVSGTSYSFTVQLEKGTVTTPVYEPYIGHSYPINLGKNLFDISKWNDVGVTRGTINVDTTNNILTITNSSNGGDCYSLTGMSTSQVSQQYRKYLFKIKPNTTYTISYNIDGESTGTTTSTYTCYYAISDESYTTISYSAMPSVVRPGRVVKTITTGSNAQYIALRFGTKATASDQCIYKNIQIEENPYATSYSAYKTPIELCKIGDYQDSIKKSTGKNLFDKNSIANGYLNADGTLSSDNAYRTSDFIPVKSNTAYYKTTTGSPRTKFFDIDKQPLNTTTYQDVSIGGSAGTFTTPENACYFRFSFPFTGSYAIDPDTIMINIGSTSSTYEPYGKVWYKEGKIRKVVLDGTENWTAIASGNLYYITGVGIKLATGITNIVPIFSDYYTVNNYQNLYDASVDYGISSHTTDRLCIRNKDMSSVSDFKTYLGTHNTTAYYPLANPTYEIITDTELIGQLEAIELLSGLNNISVNNFSQAGDIQIYYNYRNAETITDMIFCGVIKNTGSVSLNPREPHYCDLQVLDFKTFLSEGKTLDFVISNKTITEAINMVINSISDYGFILGNIEIDAGNDIIGAYSTLNKTPYDVFQYLADISQSRWFTRVIDENTIAIDFYDLDKMPQADDIEYTEQYFKDNNIVDISFSYNTGDYRNKQEIISQQVYGNVNTIDNITSSGYEKTFITSQTIGRISSIKVDGVEKTFITMAEKSLGLSADFYYAAGKNEVESETSYAAGQVISISYIPLVKGRRTVNNQNEISRISEQTNRNGIISRYEERNDILDGDELTKVAETYIKYKGTPEIILNVVTVNKDLFEIGQQVYFNMPSVQDLATNYMVKKKDIEITQIGEYGNVFYTYELSSSFNSESAINFFDNQRRKAEGNITEDEFITRNVEVDNTALIIFDGLQIEEVTPTGDNTLNSTLNSPFIN